MYIIEKILVSMLSLNELRWDFSGRFHFSKISSESYKYLPLQKTKKRDKRGVFVAKGRDSEWVEYFDWIEYFDWVKYSEWIEYSEWVEYSDWIRSRGRVKNFKSGRVGRAEKVRKKLDRAGPDLCTE